MGALRMQRCLMMTTDIIKEQVSHPRFKVTSKQGGCFTYAYQPAGPTISLKREWAITRSFHAYLHVAELRDEEEGAAA